MLSNPITQAFFGIAETPKPQQSPGERDAAPDATVEDFGTAFAEFTDPADPDTAADAPDDAPEAKPEVAEDLEAEDSVEEGGDLPNASIDGDFPDIGLTEDAANPAYLAEQAAEFPAAVFPTTGPIGQPEKQQSPESPARSETGQVQSGTAAASKEMRIAPLTLPTQAAEKAQSIIALRPEPAGSARTNNTPTTAAPTAPQGPRTGNSLLAASPPVQPQEGNDAASVRVARADTAAQQRDVSFGNGPAPVSPPAGAAPLSAQMEGLAMRVQSNGMSPDDAPSRTAARAELDKALAPQTLPTSPAASVSTPLRADALTAKPDPVAIDASTFGRFEPATGRAVDPLPAREGAGAPLNPNATGPAALGAPLRPTSSRGLLVPSDAEAVAGDPRETRTLQRHANSAAEQLRAAMPHAPAPTAPAMPSVTASAGLMTPPMQARAEELGAFETDTGLFAPASEQLRSGQAIVQAVAPMRADSPAAVVRQMAEHADLLRQNTVDLRLNPEELGRVKMRLSISETGITLTITSERSETQDLLRRHIDDLGREFAAMGFADVTFSFDGQGASSDHAEKGNDAPQDHPKMAATNNDLPGPAQAQLGASSPPHAAASGLDLRL